MKRLAFVLSILLGLGNFMVSAMNQITNPEHDKQQLKSETEKLKERIKSLEEKNKALETAHKLFVNED